MMKGQKGITLVALIITIIVMLILVGVSISVALNGGLFTNARTASRQTKQAQVSEAVALAKAELLSDFYSAKTDADRDAPTADEVATAVQSYLDKDSIDGIKAEPVSGATNKWTITTPDVDYDENEAEPILDLSDLDFAATDAGSDDTTGDDTTGA